MNVKIISDGTPYGTRVLDASGNQIPGVVGVQWELLTRDVFAEVTLKLIDVEVELVGEIRSE